jgi:serine/threonine protein kinase
MSITPGTRIGPYEVTSQLGEGGMGVVFRARDSRLQRDVALKLLPAHFANDPDRLARFQREAQVLASLNHPNIAQIYGLEQAGSSCIVMELVEGDTLADRVKCGPIPIEDALRISRQIVDALEAAHARGIVHRDLKPANIKLTPEGKVKVLDFGLAKALAGPSSGINASNSPTVMDGSVVGVVMGTAAYMSPEQARGKDVDARTDIWAFGCVLYEMLTGRQVFEGETATDIIAKIIAGHPDWNLLPNTTTSPIRVLLSVALSKEPQQRLQHVGDVRPFLNSELFAERRNASASPQAHRGRVWLAAGVTAILVISVLVSLLLYSRPATVEPDAFRFETLAAGVVASNLSVSPDGRVLAYTAVGVGRRSIWIQPIGSITARPLQGTEGATGLFWSPDNRHVAFFAENKLKKIDVSSGAVQTISEAVTTARGAWNRDDTILFTSPANPGRVPGFLGLVRVSATGGPVTPVTEANLPGKELFHIVPQFLSGGRRFVFNAGDAPGPRPKFAVYLGALESSSVTRLLDIGEVGVDTGNSLAFYAPGYLLFIRNRALMAQRLDETNQTLSGEPVVIAENVANGHVSQNGVLVYQHRSDQTFDRNRQQLLWLDRSGKRVGEAAPAAAYEAPSISRDGRRLALGIAGSSAAGLDIWAIDLATTVPAQLTFEPGIDTLPIWSPDGTRIAFASDRGENRLNAPRAIYQKLSNGSGADQLLFEPDPLELAIPQDWSPDGQNILFFRQRGNSTQSDLWMLPSSGAMKPSAYLTSPHRKRHAQFSPDGRWIAYTSEEFGDPNIIVQPFPDPAQGKWRISLKGGVQPRWRRDGRELFYLALDGTLTAVPVKSGPTFEWGAALPLFQTGTSPRGGSPAFSYDVTPDGQRFLFMTPAAPPATESNSTPNPITVVINWTAALRKK